MSYKTFESELRATDSCGTYFLLLNKEQTESKNDKSEILNSLPDEFCRMLKELEDVYPEELPQGLPPIRGIEHHIDFVFPEPLYQTALLIGVTLKRAKKSNARCRN